jgi:hypothetical protein
VSVFDVIHARSLVFIVESAEGKILGFNQRDIFWNSAALLFRAQAIFPQIKALPNRRALWGVHIFWPSPKLASVLLRALNIFTKFQISNCCILHSTLFVFLLSSIIDTRYPRHPRPCHGAPARSLPEDLPSK